MICLLSLGRAQAALSLSDGAWRARVTIEAPPYRQRPLRLSRGTLRPPVTRLSAYFLPTEREAPADAEAISHKLMVRAGLVRQVGSGLWSWLPAGWRVHQRIVQIVREEMNAIGGQEMLMPVLHPAEPWRRTGRYGIEEVFKLKDRKGADMVLALTHEEIVTQHVAAAVRSYRDREGLDAQYDKHVVAYDRMMDRCGLEWYRVEADVGMMGGFGAHEYMAPCPAGENEVA